jgi:hypothetical protein
VAGAAAPLNAGAVAHGDVVSGVRIVGTPASGRRGWASCSI